MKRVIVTGSNGFAGDEVKRLRNFLHLYDRLRVIDRQNYPLENNFFDVSVAGGVLDPMQCLLAQN